jgi:flagellar basal-body rod protein FlgC
MTATTLDFQDILKVASSGMRAQGERMRIIAENIANANSTASTPGGEPYQRRVVLFKNILDKVSGASLVKVAAVRSDKSAFGKVYDPSNPAADPNTGYVLQPNVKPLIEMVDMREAQRGYEANLSIIDSARNMLARALDILRG